MKITLTITEALDILKKHIYLPEINDILTKHFTSGKDNVKVIIEGSNESTEPVKKQLIEFVNLVDGAKSQGFNSAIISGFIRARWAEYFDEELESEITDFMAADWPRFKEIIANTDKKPEIWLPRDSGYCLVRVNNITCNLRKD